MTRPLDELKKTLAALCPETTARLSDGRDEPILIAWVFDVDGAIDAFAATHCLVDITTCGEQCPAWHREYCGNDPLDYCAALPDGNPYAPTGKPCIWKQP